MPKTEMTEAEYQRLRRRERRLVLFALAVLLAVVYGGLVYVLFEPVYEASSWLQIEATAPYIAFQTQDDSRRFIATQEQLIRSPMVLGPVVTQPEIARMREIEEQDDPITWLGEQIEVESVGQSELFTVSLRSPEPANAARIVNAVTEAFFLLRGQQDAQRVQRVIELLDQERERRASELARLRENVRELTKQATGRDPFAAKPPGEAVVQAPLADLEARLATMEVEQEVLKARLMAFEELVSQREVEVPDALVEERIAQNTFVQELEKLIAQKRLKLFNAETTVGGTDGQPLVRRLEQEIQKAELELAEVRNKLLPQVKKEVDRDIVKDREWQLAQMQSELENYSFMQEALRQRYESQLAGLKQFSGETLELEFKRAELARAKEVFDLITARAVRLRTEQRAPARINMLQSATVPIDPVEPVSTKMALGAVAGFCLPFVLVGLRTGIARVRAKSLKSRRKLASRVR